MRMMLGDTDGNNETKGTHICSTIYHAHVFVSLCLFFFSLSLSLNVYAIYIYTYISILIRLIFFQ